MTTLRSTKACFLDIDGVLQDLYLLSDQWSEQLGLELSRHFGEEPKRWADANRDCFGAVWARRDEFRADPAGRHEDLSLAILESMCLDVGVTVPQPCSGLALMTEWEVAILRRGTAIFEGAGEAVRRLAATRTVHMATANPSYRIEATLFALGAVDCVGLRTGPDVALTTKTGPLFYERVFAMSGVVPELAVVVDDQSDAIAWAKQAGAWTVHVDGSCRDCHADEHIGIITELPQLLAAPS